MSVYSGKRLKSLRKKQSLSLRKLAITAVIPVSTLSALETGTRQVGGLRMDTATRLARSLGIDLNSLGGFYAEDEPDVD